MKISDPAFDDYEDDYERLENTYLNLMSEIEKLAMRIEQLVTMSPSWEITKNDQEILGFDSITIKTHNNIRTYYKKAYKNKDTSIIYALTKQLTKLNTYMEELIEKFEEEHQTNYRKKKFTKVPKRKPIKKCKCK